MNPNSEEPPRIAILDDYLDYIKSNEINLVKSKILNFNKDGIIIDQSGKREFIKTDSIICSTGYRSNLHFLSDDIKNKIRYRPDDPKKPVMLYKTIFHPELPNMAFLGFYRGTYWGVLEMQARYATSIFSKQIRVPEKNLMEEDLRTQYQNRHLKPKPHFPNGDYIDRMDDMAKQIGVFPDLDLYRRSDSGLYNVLLKNSVTPHQFRLNGSNSQYTISRKVIMNLNTYIKSLNDD